MKVSCVSVFIPLFLSLTVSGCQGNVAGQQLKEKGLSTARSGLNAERVSLLHTYHLWQWTLSCSYCKSPEILLDFLFPSDSSRCLYPSQTLPLFGVKLGDGATFCWCRHVEGSALTEVRVKVTVVHLCFHPPTRRLLVSWLPTPALESPELLVLHATISQSPESVPQPTVGFQLLQHNVTTPTHGLRKEKRNPRCAASLLNVLPATEFALTF